jgi:hypothetical protein
LAEILSVEADEFTRHVTVRCPLCGKKHLHGVPYESGREPTHRVAHCWDNKPRQHIGYWIPAIEGWGDTA